MSIADNVLQQKSDKLSLTDNRESLYLYTWLSSFDNIKYSILIIRFYVKFHDFIDLLSETLSLMGMGMGWTVKYLISLFLFFPYFQSFKIKYFIYEILDNCLSEFYLQETFDQCVISKNIINFFYQFGFCKKYEKIRKDKFIFNLLKIYY